MPSRKARINVAAAACLLVLVPVFASSCASPEPAYRVAVVGFEDGHPAVDRNSLAEYGRMRVEAELGAEVDFFVPGSGYEAADLFSSDEGGYDLVVSLGQDSCTEMLLARPGDTTVQAAALDFESAQAVAGEEAVSLVRYRVEEGAYVCGYLAGWLTGRNDHPLTNTLPDVAFIAAVDDPMQPYYDRGFSKGVMAAATNPGIHRYFIADREDYNNARAYAEKVVEKGVDIIFCTPGPFNDEVIEVAEEKNILVILVGADRSEESPDHILTTLILRDDNALFDTVDMAMDGDLEPGRQVWGIAEGTWTLAPFYGHDLYVRKELKEALRLQEEKVSGIDFSS